MQKIVSSGDSEGKRLSGVGGCCGDISAEECYLWSEVPKGSMVLLQDVTIKENQQTLNGLLVCLFPEC